DCSALLWGIAVIWVSPQPRQSRTQMPRPMQERVRYDVAGEASVPARAPARERWSWALYDFANTIFSMNVATLYFAVWLVCDLGTSNMAYGVANAIASTLVLLALPILGAISDARRRRKSWVVGFTVASCVACACIGIFGQTTLPLVGENVVRDA